METVVGLLLLVALVWLLIRAAEGLRDIARRRMPDKATTPPAPPPAAGAGEERDAASDVADVVQAADGLAEAYGWEAASRAALLSDDRFTGAVSKLEAHHLSTEAVVRLARDNRRWLARIAAAVLATREDIPDGWAAAALRRVRHAAYDHAGLLLLSLTNAPGEVVGPALSQAGDVHAEDLVALCRLRIESGREEFDVERMRRHVGRSVGETIAVLVDEHGDELPVSVREACVTWLAGQVDLGPDLGGAVDVWVPPYAAGVVELDADRSRVVDGIVDALAGESPESVVVIGEHGVGKSTVVRAALDRMGSEWVVFEAGAGALNAGAMFVGQLEGRVEELVRRLQGRRAVWVFPAFEEALSAGAYTNDPRGLLDALLPHLESGAIRVVAETSPEAYEGLVAARPRVVSALRPLRLRPLSEEATAALCADVAREGLGVQVSDGVVREAWEYAQQFLPGSAPPGNVVRLLSATAAHVLEEGREEVAGSDLLATLSRLTGIPTSVLDASQPLGLDQIRGFFEERVLGQREAVDVLVDRIALIKSGLTDPTRPLGVFLFVGPTGTGKTELAKALAELVFGSPTRLVRLDMSEYQTPEGLERLLADANREPTASPLIAAVRRDPFSVVLLDEFEKAADPIRDLFLQLFDDGRLTDRSGRTTDFRRCVVIMTSNAGSAVQAGPGLGFSDAVEPFREADVERALRRTFRPEFLNRIDRIVVFRPFDRSQMRALLEKELDDVVRRRGLRDRPWALEVDDGAVAFLIEKGFTPDLGARPLKRAVEQYVLTPIARAIAEAQAPSGDQFLFLTAAGDRVDVQFVGLEPTEEEAVPEPHAAEEGAPLDGAPADAVLRMLLRDRVRGDDVTERLLVLLDAVDERVDERVAEPKERLLVQLSAPGFWERDDRFGVLAEAEYLDRLEEATRTAHRLADRLRGATQPHARQELRELLASRLYVLDRALAGLDDAAPFELFLRLRPAGGTDGDEATAFLGQVVGMYRGWARRHGMTIRDLAVRPDEALIAVSGLGAGMILRDEAGLHVLEKAESRDGDTEVERIAVGVEVAPAPPGEPTDADQLARRARETLDAAAFPGHVTRRYCFAPSPLVRDTVRGYRTGRIDRVLAGDFDLMV